MPREVASFVPPVPEGETRVCSNDACVDARGLLYLIDRGRGLHILERGEHRRRPSRVAVPAAGRHPGAGELDASFLIPRSWVP
jgi:hypothetical protein